MAAFTTHTPCQATISHPNIKISTQNANTKTVHKASSSLHHYPSISSLFSQTKSTLPPTLFSNSGLSLSPPLNFFSFLFIHVHLCFHRSNFFFMFYFSMGIQNNLGCLAPNLIFLCLFNDSFWEM